MVEEDVYAEVCIHCKKEAYGEGLLYSIIFFDEVGDRVWRSKFIRESEVMMRFGEVIWRKRVMRVEMELMGSEMVKEYNGEAIAYWDEERLKYIIEVVLPDGRRYGYNLVEVISKIEISKGEN